MKNSNNSNFKTILIDFLKNIKSLGIYSASDLSFWHPLVTPSEYNHQNLLHQYPEYESYFNLYLKLKAKFNGSFSTKLIDIYKEYLFQKKFNNSIIERNILYFVEFCFLIEKNQKHAKIVSEILLESVEKSKNGSTFSLPYFSAVYLLISDEIGEIPDQFLEFTVKNLFKLQVFENSKNKLLFSNFISYAFERELIDETKFIEMLELLDYVPLSGSYNNFMQVVRLKYNIKDGSRSDRFLREYNLRLLENFAECSSSDFSINCKFKIHNRWRGRRIVLKVLELLAKYKNLNTNIFNDTRESTLWYILRNLWHIENDTVEETLTVADLEKFNEQTLLTLAFLSPSFAGIVEDTLKIPGLRQLVLWNISHNNLDSLDSPSYPYIRHSQNLILKEISAKNCLSIDQRRVDRIEIKWFRKILEILGEANFKKLIRYFPLPFPEKRSRTRDFAELIQSGKMKTKEDINRIIQKYPFFSNESQLHDFLSDLIKFVGEILTSSKAKMIKVIPKIWTFLDNTARYFQKPDSSYLLLPDHLNEFKKPQKQKLIIATPGKKRKHDQITIKADETSEHRLQTVMWKRGRKIKRIAKEIKQSQEFLQTEYKVQFINAFVDKLLSKHISRIVKNRFAEAHFWMQLKDTGFESLMKSMIFSSNNKFGLLEFDKNDLVMHTIDGDIIKIDEMDIIYLCNPKQIYDSGNLEKCAEMLISKRISQPTVQVFSEDFRNIDFARIFEYWTKIIFHQAYLNKALKHRGWNINQVGYICKTDDPSNFIVKLITKSQSEFPLNPICNNFEGLEFYNIDTHARLTFEDIDEGLLLSIFDDLHHALASSSFAPLNYSFSSALQLFVVKYLENQGFSEIKFTENKLRFIASSENKTKEIMLAPIEPLYFSESNDPWEYLPHTPSNFWKQALNSIKTNIRKVSPNFKA